MTIGNRVRKNKKISTTEEIETDTEFNEEVRSVQGEELNVRLKTMINKGGNTRCSLYEGLIKVRESNPDSPTI